MMTKIKHPLSAAVIGMALIATAAHAQVFNATLPQGWIATGPASFQADFDVGTQAGNRHAGDINAIVRAKQENKGFGALMQVIDASRYRGQRVRLSGWLATQDAGGAGLWMRVDSAERNGIAFDNMDTRPIKGTQGWQHYEVVLDIPQQATDIAYGFLLKYKGQALADDFSIEVVGKDVPVTGGPIKPNYLPAPTNLDFSH